MFSAENIFKLIAIKRVHYTEKGGIFKWNHLRPRHSFHHHEWNLRWHQRRRRNTFCYVMLFKIELASDTTSSI
jgi:hypothetical protein